jgi:hypothetical protein
VSSSTPILVDFTNAVLSASGSHVEQEYGAGDAEWNRNWADVTRGGRMVEARVMECSPMRKNPPPCGLCSLGILGKRRTAAGRSHVQRRGQLVAHSGFESRDRANAALASPRPCGAPSKPAAGMAGKDGGNETERNQVRGISG